MLYSSKLGLGNSNMESFGLMGRFRDSGSGMPKGAVRVSEVKRKRILLSWVGRRVDFCRVYPFPGCCQTFSAWRGARDRPKKIELPKRP